MNRLIEARHIPVNVTPPAAAHSNEGLSQDKPIVSALMTGRHKRRRRAVNAPAPEIRFWCAGAFTGPFTG